MNPPATSLVKLALRLWIEKLQPKTSNSRSFHVYEVFLHQLTMCISPNGVCYQGALMIGICRKGARLTTNR